MVRCSARDRRDRSQIPRRGRLGTSSQELRIASPLSAVARYLHPRCPCNSSIRAHVQNSNQNPGQHLNRRREPRLFFHTPIGCTGLGGNQLPQVHVAFAQVWPGRDRDECSILRHDAQRLSMFVSRRTCKATTLSLWCDSCAAHSMMMTIPATTAQWIRILVP